MWVVLLLAALPFVLMGLGGLALETPTYPPLLCLLVAAVLFVGAALAEELQRVRKLLASIFEELNAGNPHTERVLRIPKR